jgi:hypothetical protein
MCKCACEIFELLHSSEAASNRFTSGPPRVLISLCLNAELNCSVVVCLTVIPAAPANLKALRKLADAAAFISWSDEA